MRNILVIGGGPAGMMAAYQAAKLGVGVTILDHSSDVGKKILATGGGRCNLTNSHMSSDFYHCESKDFAYKALKMFGYEDAINFFTEIGLFTVDKNSYIYPRSLSAASVRYSLKQACLRKGVNIRTSVTVREIKRIETGFRVKAFSDGADEIFNVDAVILACGGIASPKSGSDGSGFVLAKSLGHKIKKTLPALMPLDGEASFCKALSGLRMHGAVSLYIDGNYVSSDSGELQFTDNTVSGIPVYNISGAAIRALNEKREVYVSLNFLPDLEHNQLVKDLLNKTVGMTVTDVMYGLFPGSAADFFIKKLGIKNLKNHLFSELNESDVREMISELKNFTVPILGYSHVERAQTSTGGIYINDVDVMTMQSVKTPGLYFAGEMIDIDGVCGGYNLQWAWTSGYIAGTSAAK